MKESKKREAEKDIQWSAKWNAEHVENVLGKIRVGLLPMEAAKEVLSPEEVKAGLQEIIDLHMRVETPEERIRRMHMYWREIDAIATKPGLSRYGALLMWVQRNGFEIKEFWAEYRRRNGRVA